MFCLSISDNELKHLHEFAFSCVQCRIFSASEEDKWHVWCSLQLFLMISLDHPELTVSKCTQLFAAVIFKATYSYQYSRKLGEPTCFTF